MTDDDDMLFTALTVLVVLFVVGGVGLIIWSFL
jgi:flagellar basal body-associated protein FliL